MRKIFIALGAIIVLLVAAAIIVPFMIPTDAYVGQVAAAVKQATGRDLKIAGPVSFHLLPDIALVANGVSLSDASGTAAMATIGRLDVGLKLAPLLSKKIEIDHLTLDQPVIHLEVDKKGQNNWTFQPQTQPAPTAAPDDKATAQLQNFSLGTIKITNGLATYLDARTGKQQSLSKLNVTLSLPDLDLSTEFNGKTISLKSAIAMNGKAFSFSKLALTIDAIKITGDLSVDANGAKPVIKGALDLGALDLTPYLAPQAAGAQAAPAAPTTAVTGWSAAPIDASALKSADADLALSLTSLKLNTIDIGKTDLALAVTNGRAAITLKDMALYGGNAAGRIGLDGSNPGIGFSSDLTLGNVAMGPLLQAAMGVSRFTGTGNLTLALASTGRSQAQLMAALSGKAGFKIADGAIKGIDLVAIEHKPLKGLAESGSSAETSFTALTGSFVLASGVANNQDLVLASPALGMTGQGQIDLYHRTINFRVVPSLPSGIQGGKSGIYGTSVPIVISGPWSAVSYAPDVSAVVQQKASQAIDKELTKLGGNSKAGSMLQGLFGGH